MEIPAWFDEKYYAQQKAEQMNALGWRDAEGNVKTDWTAADWPNELARFNAENGTDYTAYDNFLACNAEHYEAGISSAAVNVSPNAYFNVAEYLTNLANYYNSSGFVADGYAAGKWSAATALDYIFNVEHTSAWGHFSKYGWEEKINPSNKFDVEAYLEARAAKMGPDATIADALSALREEGINPLEDYYGYGKEHQIAVSAVTKPVEIQDVEIWGKPVEPVVPDTPPAPVTPAPIVPGGSSGGSSSNRPSDNRPTPDKPDTPDNPNTPDKPDKPEPGDSSETPPVELPDTPVVPGDDPFDENLKDQAVVPGEVNKGPDGQNTDFVADYGGENGNLTPDTIIQGGADANNTLSMTLGSDWPGFSGKDADGNPVANVTGVGRIIINNNTEADSLTFNAAHIEGLKQLDLDSAKSGAISVTNAPGTLDTINIKNIGGAAETSIGFATAPQELQLGVENVCQDGEAAAAIALSGVSRLKIASYGVDNFIDLAPTKGLSQIVVTAGTALNIVDSDASAITEFDSSQNPYSVNFGASNFQDGTVVRGGSASDTLTLHDEARITDAKWKNVENIVLDKGGSINAAAATGIESIWQGENTSLKVENINAKTLDVHSGEIASSGAARLFGARAAANTATASVNGDLEDVIWHSCGMKEKPVNVDFDSNVSENFTITTDGGNRLGVMSSFELPELTGKITINDPAPTASSEYTNDIHSPNYNPILDGIKLQAPNATALEITHTGSLRLCGSMDRIAEVKANLTNYGINDEPDLFKLSTLPSARNVDISLDGMEAYITQLGARSVRDDMNIAISNGAQVEIPLLESGGNLTAKIEGSELIKIDEIDVAGGLSLALTGKTLDVDEAEYYADNYFSAASVDLDFSGITTNVAYIYQKLNVQAMNGGLTYIGSPGDDNIMISALTGNTVSTVRTNGGEDDISVKAMDSIAANETATLNFELSSGDQYLRFYNKPEGNVGGNLVVNISGAQAGKTHVLKSCESIFNDDAIPEITDVAKANLALAAVNANFQLDAGTAINNGVFEHDGSAYWISGRISGGNASQVVLVEVENSSASIIGDDDYLFEM